MSHGARQGDESEVGEMGDGDVRVLRYLSERRHIGGDHKRGNCALGGTHLSVPSTGGWMTRKFLVGVLSIFPSGSTRKNPLGKIH